MAFLCMIFKNKIFLVFKLIFVFLLKFQIFLSFYLHQIFKNKQIYIKSTKYERFIKEIEYELVQNYKKFQIKISS